jgi:dGTPase
MSKMSWHELLNPGRIGRAKPEAQHVIRSPFEVDYDRLIFSSAFRRLQDKTQVFPLSESDYVRTRLTHSLEVSCVGRSLGAIVGKTICKKHRLKNVSPQDIGAVVAAACLAHDFGNPPFGHSGEDAIRHWFTNSSVAEKIKQKIPQNFHADLTEYEGNAEGFRLVTKILHPDSNGGLQLTYATLGAFSKYPIESGIPENQRKGKAGAKKFGFFNAEKDFFIQVAKNTGLLRRDNNRLWWCRHPLAFLMEAADDICYRTIDFEDGHRLKLISYKEVHDHFCRIIEQEPHYLAHIKSEKGKVQYLRSLTVNALVQQVSDRFIEVEEQCLDGSFDLDLISLIPAKKHLDLIKELTTQKIYSDNRVVEIEAAGFEVLGGLLDVFAGAAFEVAMTKRRMKPSYKSKKILALVPDQFLSKPMVPHKDTYVCLLNMIDFVCGMTDSYAVSLFKTLRGISLP